MPKHLPNTRRGFTLIELIIVIALIAILSTIVAINFPIDIKRANDAKKMSDLKQYQVALETYANSNSSLYPSYTSTTSLTTLCAAIVKSGATCPDDSKYSYKYISNGSGSGAKDATQYAIWAKLESYSTYQVYCSSGKSGTLAGSPDAGCSSL
jgi:prepilin-type N-terminal cleavage/methylation domain-containing protein